MEAVGAASSIIAVVQVGLQLAQTLYKFASDVKDAEKDVKAIAQDVRLTTIVLKHTHDQVQANAKLYTENAVKDFDQVLSGCHEAFKEVEKSLTKLEPNGGGTGVSLSAKLKWGFGQKKKVEILRANLEKLKATLLVMLNVFSLSRMIDPASAGHNLEKVEVEKLQIESLVKAKDSAAQKYEELVLSFAKLETRINSAAQPSKSGRKDLLKNDQHILSGRLGLCIAAVERLSDSIDTAATCWLDRRLFEIRAIKSGLDEAAREVDELDSCATVHHKAQFQSTQPHFQFSAGTNEPQPEGTSRSPRIRGPQPHRDAYAQTLDISPPGAALPLSTSSAVKDGSLSRKRTKSGCLTCRKRRIKCDEIRPTCSNCSKSGRLCNGYLQRTVYKPPQSELVATEDLVDDKEKEKSLIKTRPSSVSDGKVYEWRDHLPRIQERSKSSMSPDTATGEDLASVEELGSTTFGPENPSAEKETTESRLPGIREALMRVPPPISLRESSSRSSSPEPTPAALSPWPLNAGHVAPMSLLSRPMQPTSPPPVLSNMSNPAPSLGLPQCLPDVMPEQRRSMISQMLQQRQQQQQQQQAASQNSSQDFQNPSYAEASKTPNLSPLYFASRHMSEEAAKALGLTGGQYAKIFEELTKRGLNENQIRQVFVQKISQRLAQQRQLQASYHSPINDLEPMAQHNQSSVQDKEAEISDADLRPQVSCAQASGSDEMPNDINDGAEIGMADGDQKTAVHQEQSMTPPEILIDYAPPAAETTSPQSSSKTLDLPSRAINRTRAKSDSTVLQQPSARSETSSSDQFPSQDVARRLEMLQCPFCPKRFTRAYNLKSHLRTHTDERPFVCTVCGKAFARPFDCKRHERTHAAEQERTRVEDNVAMREDDEDVQTTAGAKRDVVPAKDITQIIDVEDMIYHSHYNVNSSRQQGPDNGSAIATPVADKDRSSQGTHEPTVYLPPPTTGSTENVPPAESADTSGLPSPALDRARANSDSSALRRPVPSTERLLSDQMTRSSGFRSLHGMHRDDGSFGGYKSRKKNLKSDDQTSVSSESHDSESVTSPTLPPAANGQPDTTTRHCPFQPCSYTYTLDIDPEHLQQAHGIVLSSTPGPPPRTPMAQSANPNYTLQYSRMTINGLYPLEQEQVVQPTASSTDNTTETFLPKALLEQYPALREADWKDFHEAKTQRNVRSHVTREQHKTKRGRPTIAEQQAKMKMSDTDDDPPTKKRHMSNHDPVRQQWSGEKGQHFSVDSSAADPAGRSSAEDHRAPGDMINVAQSVASEVNARFGHMDFSMGRGESPFAAVDALLSRWTTVCA